MDGKGRKEESETLSKEGKVTRPDSPEKAVRPVLVLIHGLGGPLMWQRVEPILSAQFRVIRIDLPGFGNTPAPVGTMNVGEHAAYIIHVLDGQGIQRAHIAGISYGGQVAATVAAQFPDRIETLVLLCSTGLMPDRFIASNKVLWGIVSFVVRNSVLRSRSLMCRFGKSSFYDIASRPANLCNEFFKQLSQLGARDAWLGAACAVSTGREQFLNILKTITTPTLIIWGENDSTVPPLHASEFLAAIPGSRLIIFPECAHSVPLEKPAELCVEIGKFLLS